MKINFNNNLGKFLKSIIFPLLFEVLVLFFFFHSWKIWIDYYGMNGLFSISMSNHNILEVGLRFFSGQNLNKETLIFKDLITKLVSLKLGFVNGGDQFLFKDRWTLLVWFLIFTFPIFLLAFKLEDKKSRYFLLLSFFIITVGLAIWILGIYILAINAFQNSGELSYFPSVDRYICIYLIGPILLSIASLFYLITIQRNFISKLLIFTCLFSFIFIAPFSTLSLLSNADRTQGKLEREIFKKLPKEEFLLISKASKICMIYEAPSTYKYAIMFDLIPAKLEEAYLLSAISDIKLDDILKKCNGLLAMCVSNDDCKKAYQYFPKYFNENENLSSYISYQEINRSLKNEDQYRAK